MIARMSAGLPATLLAVVLTTAAPDGAPETGERSTSPLQPPCEFPVLWRVTDVDPAFGLSADEAAQAVRQAGMLWEAALGQVLLFRESSEGIPVRFIFDDRQRHTLDRQQALAQLDQQADDIETRRRNLDALRSRMESRRSLHQARLNNFESRLASYEDLVDSWNQRGGAPPAELERLRAFEAELEGERAALNAGAQEVNGLVDEVNSETDRLNEDIAAHNRALADVDARLPPLRMQSGQLIEDVRGFGRFTLSRDYELRIYQYENRDHLLQVIAHELGHVMGLEHSMDDGSLMGEVVIPMAGGAPPAIPAVDVRAIRALCPALAAAD